MTISTKKEIPEAYKLEKKLRGKVGKAIADYTMIEESDVVMAAISGGKLCVI